MNKQYISASKVAQFLYCPFTLELGAAGYEPQEPYVPAVATGSAFHTAFVYVWTGMDIDDAAEAAIAATELAFGQQLSEEDKIAVIKRLKALPSWVLEASDVEIKFEADIAEDIAVTGYLDALAQGRIIELKAVARMKYELPPTYMIQAQIYMYAMNLDITTFVFVDPRGGVNTFDVRRMDRGIVREMLSYFAHSMRQQYKPPSGLTNFACNRCSFAYVCPFVKTLKQTKTP